MAREKTVTTNQATSLSMDKPFAIYDDDGGDVDNTQRIYLIFFPEANVIKIAPPRVCILRVGVERRGDLSQGFPQQAAVALLCAIMYCHAAKIQIHKCANANTQICKYKYTKKQMQIYQYANTNTQISKCKYTNMQYKYIKKEKKVHRLSLLRTELPKITEKFYPYKKN